MESLFVLKGRANGIWEGSGLKFLQILLFDLLLFIKTKKIVKKKTILCSSSYLRDKFSKQLVPNLQDLYTNSFQPLKSNFSNLILKFHCKFRSFYIISLTLALHGRAKILMSKVGKIYLIHNLTFRIYTFLFIFKSNSFIVYCKRYHPWPLLGPLNKKILALPLFIHFPNTSHFIPPITSK